MQKRNLNRARNLILQDWEGFVACGVLSQKNDDPTKASRPWDTQGDGFVLGEVAGVLPTSCEGKALADSGRAREDINYVNGHATCASVDFKEYQAIIHCFGQNTEAIETGWIHPNINLEHPSEAVDDHVPDGPKKESVDIKVALSNSLGFRGHNSSIALAPYREDNLMKDA